MLEELKDKMDRLYHDHDNKQLQKEIMGLALTELSNICISGLQVYEDNKDYINNMIGQDLVNSDTCSHIREFLIEENDMEGFEKYIWHKRESVERVYSRYFESFTSIQEDGQIYNSILNMYWNRDAGIWQSDGSDGWVRFTMMMPYQDAAQDASVFTQSETKVFMVERENGYEKAYV